MNKATPRQAEDQPLIELKGINKVYGVGSAAMKALQGVDLCIDQGEFSGHK